MHRQPEIERASFLSFSDCEIKRFHYLVGEQFFAGFSHMGIRIGFISSIYMQSYMFAYAHIMQHGQAQVMKAVVYRFALWVEQFFKGMESFSSIMIQI